MRVMKFIAPVAAFISLAAVPGSAFAGSDPTGIWLNDTGRGAVEIKACGSAMCGNVVWVKSATDAGGCGKQVIGNVASVGAGRWDNGWIFSPERNRKYDVELTPLANGNLKVVGYAGMKFLSKTMIWKPAPADLQLCGQTEATKKPEITTGTIPPPPAPAAPSAATSASMPAPAKEAEATASEKTPPIAAAPAAKPDQAQAPATAPADETAKDDTGAPDDGNDIAGALGKIKIGDLSLDKVLTKTKSGKCKLDLPWLKVTIDCEQ
ncbi:DUF2147 domain-containing protein [Hyphomicrobium sp.]|jgi:uncharacterized protein (DUF2147 family)|uniref:DUF2147 domain-containing protein n=1 Tax=Hyphomicrobium sp. TaxID=82 RepID=UPI00356734B0